MKTIEENRKMRGVVQHRWGERLMMSIFPLNKGNHRVTFRFKGKEYHFAGKDRMKLLEEAFKEIKKLNK